MKKTKKKPHRVLIAWFVEYGYPVDHDDLVMAVALSNAARPV